MSWDFDVFQGDDRRLTRLDLARILRRATFRLEGTDYTIARTAFRGPLHMMVGGEPVASASTLGFFRRGYDLTVAGLPRYRLRPRRPLSRHFGLFAGPREVGRVGPEKPFRRTLKAELPSTLSLPDRIFILFLVILTWRRDAQASGA